MKSAKRNAPEYHKLYKTRRWHKLRASKLKRHPWCQCPHCEGKQVKADTVDHITPHRGDTRLFWDMNNLQSMTRECHSKYKQSQEAGGKGFNQGCDVNGFPLNPDAEWYE